MSGFLQAVQSATSNAVNTLRNPPGSLPLTANSSSVPTGYLVTLSGTDETGTKIGYNNSGYITCFLPEVFEITTTSSWDTLLPSDLASLSSYVSSGLANLVKIGGGITQALTGFTGQIPAFSQLFWTSTTPISFNLNLQFNAVSDAAAEVSGNIQSLLSLTLPSLNTQGTGNSAINFLQAPGPTLLQGGSGNSNYNINLSIGTKWLFSNVIIQDVSATIDTMPTATGDYISAVCHVRVSTNRIYTKQDLNNAFNNTAQSASQLSPGTITKLSSDVTSITSQITKFSNFLP